MSGCVCRLDLLGGFDGGRRGTHPVMLDHDCRGTVLSYFINMRPFFAMHCSQLGSRDQSGVTDR